MDDFLQSEFGLLICCVKISNNASRYRVCLWLQCIPLVKESNAASQQLYTLFTIFKFIIQSCMHIRFFCVHKVYSSFYNRVAVFCYTSRRKRGVLLKSNFSLKRHAKDDCYATQGDTTNYFTLFTLPSLNRFSQEKCRILLEATFQMYMI